MSEYVRTNHRKPMVRCKRIVMPAGNVQYAEIVDEREMALSVHTTWEKNRQDRLYVSVYAENNNAFAVLLDREGVQALRDALTNYLDEMPNMPNGN